MSEDDILITKKKVRKAGENIRLNQATENDYKVVSSWRNIHILIMTGMVNAINKKLKKYNLDAIVARRLKRLNSIVFKLKRFDTMNLDRINDIAGVRVVFKNLEQVYFFQKIMEKTYLKGGRKFTLIKTNDYINNPKLDGYRSIHQIFEYKDISKRCLELQIRTQLQHYWATAVEVLGMKTNSKLKQGEGEEYFKEFFKLCSALFSMLENVVVIKEYEKLDIKKISEKIQKLDKQYNIIKILSSLAISSKKIEKNIEKNNYYFLILLDLKNNSLKIKGFQKNDFDFAQVAYRYYESHENIDAVLISLDKIKLLKKAYPNYYLDCAEFIKKLSSVIKNS